MNGILVVDKPEGWTSHDVIAKLRRLLSERRIGHSGTLDPMATGVLPVFVGRATRAVQFAESDEKEYIASIKLGTTTDTLDITGQVLTQRYALIPREAFIKTLELFKGESMQIPPMYSAVKIGGKKLYELARNGVSVERQPRRIVISELELLSEQPDGFSFRVVCSKGTYIRTLCGDIGEKLGCGAVMSALRRTRAGIFKESDALSLEQIAETALNAKAEALLRGVDTLFLAYPSVTVDKNAEAKLRNGTDFVYPGAPEGLLRVYGLEGVFLMLGRGNNGIIHTVKSFF